MFIYDPFDRRGPRNTKWREYLIVYNGVLDGKRDENFRKTCSVEIPIQLIFSIFLTDNSENHIVHAFSRDSMDEMKIYLIFHENNYSQGYFMFGTMPAKLQTASLFWTEATKT